MELRSLTNELTFEFKADRIVTIDNTIHVYCVK